MFIVLILGLLLYCIVFFGLLLTVVCLLEFVLMVCWIAVNIG